MKRVIFVLILGLSIATVPTFAASLNTAQLIRWGCPVNLNASPPQLDADGSRLLLHVQDAAGNNFEVRCEPTFAGWHYAYYVSFPDGTSQEISQCIYSVGLNDAMLVYSGAKSEVISPTGTPVINVGAIRIVEHSNIEATGMLGVPLKPKVGGEDFHMIYDYEKKYRYRVNTIVGTGGVSTDYFATYRAAPTHKLLHAEYAAMSTKPDYAKALAGDTKFRQLDYPNAVAPCGDCDIQDADVDASYIGYAYISEEDREGGVLLDQTMHGSSFMLIPGGVIASVPRLAGRTISTLAISRGLFPEKATALAVFVDGAPVDDVATRRTDSMISLEFSLGESSHSVVFLEQSDRESEHESKTRK